MKNKCFARVTAVLVVMLLLSFAGCRSADPETELPDRVTAESVQTTSGTSADQNKSPVGKQTETKKQEPFSKEEKTEKQTAAGNSSKTKTTAKQTTTERTSPAVPKRRSLVGETYDLTADVARKLLSGTVDFGPGGIRYQNPQDRDISVRVRSGRNSGGGLQLYLSVENRTGRPIRLNGYSNFVVRDLLGNELLSTDISLNKPIVLNDREGQLVAVTLPKEWYELDDLYQLTLEAGIFHTIIALDYDFL